MLTDLSNSVSSIMEEVYSIMYYMNGGITRNECMELSPIERANIISFINDIHKKQSGNKKEVDKLTK